jgi:hypothetical protein
MPSSCAMQQGTDRTGDISAARSHRSPPMQLRTRVICSSGFRQSAAASAQAGSSDKTRETRPAARHPRRVKLTVFFLPPSDPLSPPGPRRRQTSRWCSSSKSFRMWCVSDVDANQSGLATVRENGRLGQWCAREHRLHGKGWCRPMPRRARDARPTCTWCCCAARISFQFEMRERTAARKRALTRGDACACSRGHCRV